MWISFNPNPSGTYVGDCVIRALSKALNKSWYDTFIELCLQGLSMCDMPSSNRVWHEYLKSKDYKRFVVPIDFKESYTIKDFCGEHFKGKYILGTGSHVVAVEDGDYYDTWDSGEEYPVYYWSKED